MRGRHQVALGAILAAAACCSGPAVKRTYPEPRAEELLAHLAQVKERVKSLRADTQSDARVGGERANVQVLIMAAWGGKLRFMAMNPSGDTANDLASDGTTYCFVDRNKGCGGCGPSTPENVARIIRIVMPPDDVVTFLLGSTPVLHGAQAKVSWDSSDGAEIVQLTDGAHVQRIKLDGRNRSWDVLESELKTSKGDLVWRVRHKDYHDVGGVRLPGKSLFEDPKDNVLIRWREQEPNVEIDETKFRMDLAPGIPPCQ